MRRKCLYLVLAAVFFCLTLLCSCGSGKTGTDSQTGVPSAPSAETSESPAAPAVPESPASPEPEPSKTPDGPDMGLELRRYSVDEGENGDGGYVQLLHSNYDLALLSAEGAERFPALADALEDYSFSFRRSFEAELEQDLAWAKEQYAYDPESFYAYYDDAVVTVRRADGKVLSLLSLSASYTGGVHGSSYYTSRNYNAATGKSIGLEEVIPDIAALRGVLEESLLDKYGSEPFFDLHESLESYDAGSFTWTLDPEGATFWFSPYALAYYAAGSQTVFLSFDRYPSLFSGKWGKQEGNWAMGINSFEECVYDTRDGQDAAVQLMLSRDAEETEYYSTMVIACSGKELEQELGWCYTVTPLVLHSEDAGSFLYLDCAGDNDFHVLFVYALEEGGPRLCGNLGRTGFSSEWDGTGNSVIRTLPVTPDSFPLDVRNTLMSTVLVTESYHLGPDGMPEREKPWFDIPDGFTLTALRDMDLPLVDPATGSETGRTAHISSGDTLVMARTDTESYVDLSFGGSLCRATVSVGEDGWPQFIGGIELEQCFDGTVFAG